MQHQSEQAVAVGTRGWVFNGPQLYACRVEQVEPRGYFVHYEGWKKKWDDWVKPSEFLEDNEENRLRSEQIKSSLKRAKSSPTAASSETKRQRPDLGGGEEDDQEQEQEEGAVREVEAFDLQQHEVEEVYSEQAMRALLPDELKALLIRDWENYMLNDKQISLPCPVSVKQILIHYAESKKLNQAGYLQFAQALEIYFNRALPVVLLYKDEDVGEGEGEFSERFGVEHLLRMCVRLNLMLAGLDEVDGKQLCVKVSDLLKHIARKRKDYFTNTYVSRKPPAAATTAAAAAPNIE